MPQTVKVDTVTWQKINTKNIPPGAYTFSCQSSSRCGDQYEKSIAIQINPNPSPSQPPRRGGVSTPCLGDSVFLKVENPISGYRYFWSTGHVDSLVVVKQTGKYSLDSISNAFGCGIKVPDTVSVVIKDAAKPAVPIITPPLIRSICEETKTTLSIVNYPLSIKKVWSNGQEGDSIVVVGSQELGISKKYWAYGQSGEGCVSFASDTILVVEIPNPQPLFVSLDSVITRENMSNQNYCVQGLFSSKFSFLVTGGQKVDSSENCITINWNPLSTVNYPLSIKATETLDSPHCSGSVIQSFTYQPSLQIPTLITPNGDGKNDTFEIEDLEYYSSHSLQILNRWGKKVLESSDYKNDWQGEAGVYFYSLIMDGKMFSDWLLVEK